MGLTAMLLFAIACDDELPSNPREWSHSDLMKGAKIEAPADTNDIRIVYLKGNYYQMGYQHGYLLKEEMNDVYQTTVSGFPWAQALALAETLKPANDDRNYIDFIKEVSLPSVKEECEGLAAGSSNIVTYDICLAYNGITYILEDLLPRYPEIAAALECSGFIVKGDATADKGNTMYHGRNLDWLAIDFIMENPLLFVKKANGAIPMISMGFPGFIGVLSGVNEYGITIAMDENSCQLDEYRDLIGVPPIQMQYDILLNATNFTEVESMIDAYDQATCQMFIVSDATNGKGGVFEMWGGDTEGYNLRELADSTTGDVVMATNHFEHPDSQAIQDNRDITDLTDNSVSRYYRLSERITGKSITPHPDLDDTAPDYSYGEIDVEVAIDILRDPVDLRPAYNRFQFQCYEYENGNWALGNNHNVHSVIFAADLKQFYYAAGWDEECTNSIYNPYVGFDIADLLDWSYTSGLVPTYDPAYNDSYGEGTHPFPWPD